MKITVSTELTDMTCPCCGGVYAISQQYLDEARRKGSFEQCWACPYCKQTRGYGKSKHEIAQEALQKQIEELKQKNNAEAAQRAYFEQEAEHFRKSRDKAESLLKKHKKRVSNGVCPCCNRTFINLQRHMASKHPGK
jgi:DNA repair exonuclease SbcCD ATPase subunit